MVLMKPIGEFFERYPDVRCVVNNSFSWRDVFAKSILDKLSQVTSENCEAQLTSKAALLGFWSKTKRANLIARTVETNIILYTNGLDV